MTTTFDVDGDGSPDPGSGRFTVQWTGVPHFDSGELATFQVILIEAGNRIEFRYGNQLALVSPTVGVETA
jgi:hypothetical protein